MATCTIPRDGSESSKIGISGAIRDVGKFYDGVISLLKDKQIDHEEIERLTREKADTILTALT